MRASGGRGADLIVDGLGERGVRDNLASLALFGHWVSVGQATGMLQPLDPHELLAKSINRHRRQPAQARLAGRDRKALAAVAGPQGDRAGARAKLDATLLWIKRRKTRAST
jgi:NADPH:quinone reductase-like Zn-dependent oxidoreductase